MSADQLTTTQRLIAHCRTLARIFDEELPVTAIAPADYRVGGVNPYYNRTTSGLYLEFYYGYPSKVWTPGGYWTMTGSTITHAFVDKDALAAKFMARITARQTEPLQQSKWGCYGPVYAVTAIDGEPIDEPGEVIPYATHNYREIKAEWADLAEGWRS